MSGLPNKPRTLKGNLAYKQRFKLRQQAHIRPLANYVKRLQARYRRKVPYFDPLDGGVNAQLLFVLQNPGPKVKDSRFISRDNDDRSAAKMFRLLRKIPRNKTLLWNVVPWYNEKDERLGVTNEEIEKGTRELQKLIYLLKSLKAVILVGARAHRAILDLRLPSCVELFATYHPSPRVGKKYQAHIRKTFQRAGKAFA